jgi:imidazolonepropionase-like amidohydrolase
MTHGSPSASVLLAARLLDGLGGVMTPAAILVEGTRIREIARSPMPSWPAAARRITLPHCTLMPGLIDAHAHLNLPGDGTCVDEAMSSGDAELVTVGVRNAEQTLRAGITTLRDCGGRGNTPFNLRGRLAATGPRLLVCGAPITPPGGHGRHFGGETSGPAGLRERVSKLAARGADFAKFMASGGGTPGSDPWDLAFPEGLLRAAVATAHQHGLPAAVHCLSVEATAAALAAGADQLGHVRTRRPGGAPYVPFPTALADRIAAAAFVCPTISVSCHAAERATTVKERDTWRRRLEEDLHTITRLVQAGTQIVAGTDAGWRWTPFGTLADELQLLHKAGLPTHDAIKAATSHAATALRIHQTTGSLVTGLQADILAIPGDPLTNLNRLRRPHLVMRAGRLALAPRQVRNEQAAHEYQRDTALQSWDPCSPCQVGRYERSWYEAIGPPCDVAG